MVRIQMFNNMRTWFLILLVFSACSEEDRQTDQEAERETHHPFLIVKKEQFQDLREKADREPWASIKADALQRSGKGSKTSSYDLQYYVGAAALAYILDEENEELHAKRVKDAIVNQYADLAVQEGGSWGGVVPPMGTFFMAILALDIVYDGLSSSDIETCEEVIENQIFKIKRQGSWVDARLGTHGTWDIYKGTRTTADDAYFESIMAQITVDGVSPVTNHYAWERVGGGNSRVSKSGYMDVLEFTGIDQRYYSNERLQKFQRWLFGSSVNCSKEMAIFGDMLPTQAINNDMLHRRVMNFDMEAAGYAAWFHQDRPAIGNILTYILPNSELPEAIVPQSKIYENGGAFFRENEDDPDGLHAVLYNIKSQDEWHTHNEVNGLALSGLGNRLLVNGGRLGAPTRPAPLNNTLTIKDHNHAARVGAGIVEGFTTKNVDYANGASGPALIAATHKRNLLLIHKSLEANGYFVLIDEVETAGNEEVRNYLHPANESSVRTIEANTHYEAVIDHYPSVPGTKLSVFYSSPPASVNIEKVPSAVEDRYPGYPYHNRMEAIYHSNAKGKLNLITVLFPLRADSPKPLMTRIDQSKYSGVLMNHESGLRDIILETMDNSEQIYDDINFKATAMLARSKASINSFYFVRKGTEFTQGNVGFSADSAVSIYFSGREGVIVSNGTKIKLKGPQIQHSIFDPPAELLNSGDGFLEVQLPVGKVVFH